MPALGTSDEFDAVAKYSAVYADQVERDLSNSTRQSGLGAEGWIAGRVAARHASDAISSAPRFESRSARQWK